MDNDYANVLQFFKDGYGVELCGVLLRSMERYADLAIPHDSDAEGLWCLSTLLKCVLKDEHGVDLDI